jgi:hypothetical protein
MSFVETPFGLLPDKQSFIIPVTFRDGEFEENRSYYSNARFLEILKKQPSLYEEHLFLYKNTGDILYQTLTSTTSYIKEYVTNAATCDNHNDVLYTHGKTYRYTPNIEKQIVNMIRHQVPIMINAYLDSSHIFSTHQSVETLKNLRGEALDDALDKLTNRVMHMINDTIETQCDGHIPQNPTPLVLSAMYVAAAMSKQYTYTISKELANPDMICDLSTRYSTDVSYILAKDLVRLTDKHRILSVLLSPTLFKKVEPAAEELSRQMTDMLHSLKMEYMDRNGNLKKFIAIDIDSPEKRNTLDGINHAINHFFTSLKRVLTIDELKEFLTETTIFDECNPERIVLIENMNKLMRVIIDDYTQVYKKRDRSLMLPHNKTYQKIIKKDTLLYRGYKKIYNHPINVKNSFSFFSFNPIHLFSYIVPESNVDTLEKYLNYVGGIAVYKLKKDIEVMDFSNFSTIHYMKKILADMNAPEDVINAFERSWIIPTNSDDTFLRSSIESNDLTFMSWLCSKGYGGYVGMDVPGMHDEVAICFPAKDADRYDVENVVDYMGTIEPNEYMNFPITEEPYVSYPLLNLLNPKPNKEDL